MVYKYSTFLVEVGIVMPIYHTLNWSQEGLTLDLKPRGTFRKLFGKWIPCLSGDVLDLEFEVKSTF